MAEHGGRRTTDDLWRIARDLTPGGEEGVIEQLLVFDGVLIEDELCADQALSKPKPQGTSQAHLCVSERLVRVGSKNHPKRVDPVVFPVEMPDPAPVVVIYDLAEESDLLAVCCGDEYGLHRIGMGLSCDSTEIAAHDFLLWCNKRT